MKSNHVVFLRLTEKQKEYLVKLAKQNGMTVNAYCKKKLLGELGNSDILAVQRFYKGKKRVPNKDSIGTNGAITIVNREVQSK